METLLCKIECLRQRMHVTAAEKGISHPDVLMVSCKLDEALNAFYKMSLAEKDSLYSKYSGYQLIHKLHFYSLTTHVLDSSSFSKKRTKKIRYI
ncbi:MAG: Sporulation stage 0, Spo0E-like regulatory phosphatase [Firmicutes bacterium]|nr:Sporulation stage 0, Spo0E-like regulatory phosphatase [Bacillota bacterium]